VGVREPKSWRRYIQKPIATQKAQAATTCRTSHDHAGHGGRAGGGGIVLGHTMSVATFGKRRPQLSTMREASRRAISGTFVVHVPTNEESSGSRRYGTPSRMA
jgi:hypothetical protein